MKIPKFIKRLLGIKSPSQDMVYILETPKSIDKEYERLFGKNEDANYE